MKGSVGREGEKKPTVLQTGFLLLAAKAVTPTVTHVPLTISQLARPALLH